MDDRLLSAADLELDAPDFRLRRRALVLSVPPALIFGLAGSDAFERFGAEVTWALSGVAMALVLSVLLVLAFARQRTRVVSAAAIVLVARRFVGLVWHREYIAFDEIEEIRLAWGAELPATPGARRRWRPVSLVLRDARALLVQALASSPEAEELASRLAALTSRPVRGTTREREAQRAAGTAAPPTRLESSVFRRGDRLRITIDPRGHRGRGARFFVGFLLAAVLLLAAVNTLIAFFAHEILHERFWILAIVTTLGSVASLVIAVLLYRNRFSKPAMIHASPGRLEIRQPCWIRPPKELVITAADQPRIEVETMPGRRSPRPVLGIETSGHRLRLGRSLTRDELDWLAEAVLTAFENGEAPRPSPAPSAAKEESRVDAVPSEPELGTERRWRPAQVIPVLVLLALAGTAVSDMIRDWRMIIPFLAFAVLVLGHKNAILWWRKRQRIRAGHDLQSFTAHFAGLEAPAELLEEIYHELSQAGDWIPDVPVLPGDHLGRMYGYYVRNLSRSWVEELAETYGVEPPTDEELEDVKTVEDLVRLLAA